MITKLFGQSRLQEEFKKSILLKLQLLIHSISEIEVSQNQNSIVKRNSFTNILFNFNESSLTIQGDSLKDVLSEDHFQIVRVNNDSEPCEIFLSDIYSTDIIVMKFTIYRNYILIEGTLDNWHCKISKNINISH